MVSCPVDLECPYLKEDLVTIYNINYSYVFPPGLRETVPP